MLESGGRNVWFKFPPQLGRKVSKLALVFNPSDPFPLLEAEGPGLLASDVSYRDAQIHSAQVDSWLGFRLEPVETKLSAERPHYGGLSTEQHWIGLPLQTLQTPYTEIRTLLSLLNLKSNDHVVDLGAGYGRMAFVLAAHYPEVRFTGYEVVQERVDEGQRVLTSYLKKLSISSDTKIVCADLSLKTFKPAQARFYFLYDFGSREAISKALIDLREIASEKSITVIGRGRASRDAIERGEPWLSQVNVPRHFDHFSIYQS